MSVVFFTHRELSPLLKKEFKRIYASNKNASVLDIGCGDGVMLYDFRQIGLVGKNIKFTGIDKSEKNIGKARKLNPGYEFKKGNALNLPFNKSSFDFVYSWMVIEHVKDTEKFVTEISRVMKNNGRCYVSSIFKKRREFYFYRKNGEFVLDPTHTSEFRSEKEFKELFKKQGLRMVSFRTIPRKYSLFELLLKLTVRLHIVKENANIRKIFWENKVASRLQRILKVPAPGFYQIEIVCKKTK